MDRPMLRPGRALLGSPALERGNFRLQVRDGLVLALRLVREFAEKLQDFADQMLRPFAGVQYSDYSLIAATDVAPAMLHACSPAVHGVTTAVSHRVLFRIGDLPAQFFAEQASKFVTFGHKLFLRASASPVFVIVYPVEQTPAKRR